MKETTAWVAPIESLPASLKPIAVMQKKHFGAVLNPTRWWGRMPRLFWLVALFVGFLERRRARLSPVLKSGVENCLRYRNAFRQRIAQTTGAPGLLPRFGGHARCGFEQAM